MAKTLIFLFTTLLLLTQRTRAISDNTGRHSRGNTDSTIAVPIGGNTWASELQGHKLITTRGIENWSDKSMLFTSYIRINKQGTLQVALKAKATGTCRLQLAINGQAKAFSVQGNEFAADTIGQWQIQDTGYVKFTLSLVSGKDSVKVNASEYLISGTAVSSETYFVKSNDNNFFYWGRRGPSVHLNFPFDNQIEAAMFYSELTVPPGNDVVGSYFMANGFAEGYFGIQVNSATERRILFSIWSPFATDDPNKIPQESRILLLKKGDEVYAGAFGNEGSGGQSFLRYNWKAGVTYKFLVNASPDQKGNTVYTAYFFAPEKKQWILIASFLRPQTNTYLKKLHSFLENFLPETGNLTRQAWFSNQWVCDKEGKWHELSDAVFTYDNTAAKKYRMDYYGSAEKNKFVLKNCGFFNQYTPYKSALKRNKSNRPPRLDQNNLPR